MAEGISTLIRTAADTENRLSLVRQDILALLPHGPVVVTVGLCIPHRSTHQNAMFRGLCREIADHWNRTQAEPTTAEAIARDLKVTFGVISTEYSPVSGKRSPRLVSTTEYTVPQMAALITATLAWAADNRIPITDPRRP
jgi:hypothetical protein